MHTGIFRQPGRAAVGVVATLLASQVQALEFQLGSDWQLKMDNSISVGSGWRTQSPNRRLYTRLGGERIGLEGGLGAANVDSNNLNYRRGDRFSSQYKWLSDISLSREDYGAFLRLKAWYDEAMAHSAVRNGHQSNGFQAGRDLDDSGVSRWAKHQGFEPLDSYVWARFELGEQTLEARLGKQTIRWGEGLFFQGINQINPVNLSALGRPGADVQKEAYLPIWAAHTRFTLASGSSLEFFYQFKWEPSVIDSCGSYWSPVESGIVTQAGTSCDGAAYLPGGSAAAQYATRNYLPTAKGREGSDDGQFGVALHVQLDALNTDIGLYAMQINSRFATIGARTGDDPPGALLNGPLALEDAGLRPAVAFWEYPDGVRFYGISSKTRLGPWSIGSELSYTPNQPVQRNANDNVLGLLQGRGPVAEEALAARAAGPGTELKSNDRLAKTQFQLNAARALPAMLGAAKGSLAGEVALQFNDVGSSFTGVRYGRGFIFGNGAHASLGGGDCLATNPQPDGCRNDGYVSRFAWGYRLRAQLEYPVAELPGLRLVPSVLFAHDVEGYASDRQLNEGRRQLGLGLTIAYRSTSLALNYVTFADSAAYDTFRDHDYASAALSFSF